MRLIFFVLLSIFVLSSCELVVSEVNSYSPESALVVRAVDGDTVVLENGEKVRFVGINTPEKWEPYYKEATYKLANLIENKTVILVRDKTDRDKYGRLLRYVYFENETLVNSIMVEGGYAKAYYYPPDTLYYELFEVLQTDAQQKGIGIWNESLKQEDWTLDCPYVASKTGEVYYDSSCKYAQRIKSENRICFDTVTDAVKAGLRETKKC